MRILWVKMGGLWPPTAGGRIRSLETLSCLSRQHDVTVVTTHGPGDDPEGLRRRLPQCASIVSLPFVAPTRRHAGVRAGAGALVVHRRIPWTSGSGGWRRCATRSARSWRSGAVDVCVADFLVAAANIPHAPQVPVVLFEHNVEYMIWRRLAALERRPWRRALLEIEWRKVQQAERPGMCRRGPVDRRLRRRPAAPAGACAGQPLRGDSHRRGHGLLPAGTGAEVPHRLVFTGSMDWYPNEDAMLYFVDAILPRVAPRCRRCRSPSSAAIRSPRLRAAAARAGVVVTGTVDDVRPYVGEAAVYVVPLRAGGGTRLKIFEALAMGKAVVSTTVGAEGLAVTPGRDIAIADQPDRFARRRGGAAIAIPDAVEALGRAGRLLVQRRYSWEQVSREFDLCCESVARIRRATSGTTLALATRQSSS